MKHKKPNVRPANPKILAIIIKINRTMRIANAISLTGMTKVEIATADTIMTMILEARAASVTAVPKIRPPTVAAVALIAFGSRILASSNSSIKKA